MLAGLPMPAATRMRGSRCTAARPTRLRSTACTRLSHAGGRTAKIFALLGRRCPCRQESLTREVGNHRKERAGRCRPMKFGICGRSCATRLSPSDVLKECTSQLHPRTTEHRTSRLEWPSAERPRRYPAVGSSDLKGRNHTLSGHAAAIAPERIPSHLTSQQAVSGRPKGLGHQRQLLLGGSTRPVMLPASPSSDDAWSSLNAGIGVRERVSATPAPNPGPRSPRAESWPVAMRGPAGRSAATAARWLPSSPLR
jgi:hypothetical protein